MFFILNNVFDFFVFKALETSTLACAEKKQNAPSKLISINK